jgi:hypothetical protein
MRAKALAFLAVLLALTSLAVRDSCADIDKNQSRALIQYYFDLIKSGNYESAQGLWEPSTLARATRLGIEYDDAPVKPDCSSPVIYDFDAVKEILPAGLYSMASIDSGVIRWKFEAEVDEDKFQHFYYAADIDGYFWLVTPRDYYARDWPIEVSKYFRFYTNPDRVDHLNDIIVESLDAFVDGVAENISISPERMKLLAEQKIDYYLCSGETEVEKLSGERSRGVYDPGSDAVITTFIPHYHQVALLLMNFKLQKLPLFTQSFLRMGLATHLGGRWQRAPEVVFDFGNYILRYDVAEIDSVLSFEGFNDPASGDVTYPVGACLAEYLYTRLGSEAFFGLYRDLSGSYPDVVRCSVSETKDKIANATGASWEEFKQDFDDFLESRRDRHGLIHPGDVKTNEVLVSDGGLTLSVSDRWLKVEYQSDTEIKPEVDILFGKMSTLEGKSSMLFNEQYQYRREYQGYRYGIRLDMNETGLYDYATNQIKAKFIDDPVDKSAYFDIKRNRISAYFDKGLLDGVLPMEGQYLILK